MLIQRLREKDDKSLTEVLDLFFDGISDEKKIKRFLSDEKNYILVSKIENDIVGFAYGYELQRFDSKKNTIYIHQIEILEKFRGLGIGKDLIKVFINICKKNDCGRLFLITNKSNTPAVTLYKNTGGKATNEDDIVFVYDI